MDDLSILSKAEFARCPRCSRLIELSARECPYCRAFLTAEELNAAAQLEKETLHRKLRIYDRKNLIYGVASLAGVALIAAVQLGIHLHLWNSGRRANIVDIAGHLGVAIGNNLLPFLAIFVVLPVLAVVLMRRRRR
jgi:hypothetical protein